MFAPPMLKGHHWVKSAGAFMNLTFELYAQFSKMSYNWIPWLKQSSVHHITSISAIFEFPSCQIFFKSTVKVLTGHKKSYLLAFLFVKVFVHHSQLNLKATPSNRK